MKFALKSKTVLSSLLVIMAMAAMLLNDLGTIELSSQTLQFLQALAGAGGVMSIYGRVRADGPLTLSLRPKK